MIVRHRTRLVIFNGLAHRFARVVHYRNDNSVDDGNTSTLFSFTFT